MTPETLKRIEALVKLWRDQAAEYPVETDECARYGEAALRLCADELSALLADLDASSGERPEIQVGDMLQTERGRRLLVGRIEPRQSHVPASQWQGATYSYEDADTGGSVLDVAVVAVYKPSWRRGGATS